MYAQFRSLAHSIGGIRHMALAILALIYVVFLFPSPEYPVFNPDDGSWFMTLAINLAQYGRYTVDTFPVEAYGHHATWPPVFPAFLALIVSSAGVSWFALKLAIVGCALLGLFFYSFLWRDSEAGQWAMLLCGLSPVFFVFAHHTMTEVPYMCVVALTLLVMDRSRGMRGAALAGAIAGLAFLTRGYAIIFLPAGLLFYGLRRGPWRARLATMAAFAIPLLAAVVGWRLCTGQIIAHYPVDQITATYGNGSDLFDSLFRPPVEFLRAAYWYHLRYPVYLIVPLFPLATVLSSAPLFALSALLMGLATYGWLGALREKRGALEVWFPMILALMVVPRDTAVRYWLPFLPFLFYYLLLGLRDLGERCDVGRLFERVGQIVLLLVASIGFGNHILEPDKLRFRDTQARDFRDMAVWSRTHLPASSVVVAPHAHRFYATSLHRVFPAEKLHDSGGLPALLVREENLFLLCPDQPSAQSGLQPSLCGDRGSGWAEVHRTAEHSLLRRVAISQH